MTGNQQSPSAFLKNLRIIHLGMLGGLAIFTLIAFSIRDQAGPMLDNKLLEILTYLSLIFLLVEIPLGYWLHNNKMKSVGVYPDINSKLIAYKASHIVKIAMFEGVGFFCCVVYFFGGKNSILIQIAIVLIIMLIETPSATKLANELSLSPDDNDLFNS
jgi:uncharacterized membrane protein SirB2